MKSSRTFSISVVALALLAMSTNLDTINTGRESSAYAELISAKVKATLIDETINLQWGELPKGNHLEVSINGDQKLFVNEVGVLNQVTAAPGENRIEVTEVKPLSDTGTLKNAEQFETRMLILGSNQDSLVGADVAYGAQNLPSATRL